MSCQDTCTMPECARLGRCLKEEQELRDARERLLASEGLSLPPSPTERRSMMFRIILENVGGKLDERTFDGDEAELAKEVADFITEVGSLRDGDVIRIIEKE